MRKIFMAVAGIFLSGLGMAGELEWKEKIIPGHPRIFINEHTLPLLRERALTVAKPYFEKLKDEVDALPENPSLELDNERYKMDRSGKVILKMPATQGKHLVKYQGGREALISALVYLVTGDSKYQVKSYKYLKTALEFYLWCHEHQILSDWYNYSRIDALTAYDWLYNSLTDGQRREFIMPMLKYVDGLQNNENASYFRNHSGMETGNYGDNGIAWFAGLAAYKDGFDDKLADTLLDCGYKNYKGMMDIRDKISAGTGLLSTATPSYSFADYPRASFIFLFSWESAANEDISSLWSQMRDFPKWFFWEAIPGKAGKFYHYGNGDIPHYGDNSFNEHTLRSLYCSMAQIIHFYGRKYPESAGLARILISMLPEKSRSLGKGILPFILFNFNPDEKIETSYENAFLRQHAFYFESFGLAFMRSGFKPGDTFCLFRAGALNSNHQHYDEGHFTIFKNNFIALDSGSRTQTMHHCYYAPQSIAHNTILIEMKDEPLPHFWHPWGPDAEEDKYKGFADGGQYKLGGARCTAFVTNDNYTYVANDASKVYCPEKCREAIRQFVYIYPDYFVIYDKVSSISPEQNKKFLLHTQNEPLLLKDNIFMADNGDGRLFLRSFLPRNARFNLIGGPGKQFMASGRNWPLPSGENAFEKPNLLGQWRIEVEEAVSTEKTRFLHLIQAAGISVAKMIQSSYMDEGAREGVEFSDSRGFKWQVMFEKTAETSVSIRAWKDNNIFLDKKISDNR